jgi:hypothetical protein
MPQRIELMQLWADKVDELRSVSKAEQDARKLAA